MVVVAKGTQHQTNNPTDASHTEDNMMTISRTHYASLLHYFNANANASLMQKSLKLLKLKKKKSSNPSCSPKC